MQARDIMTTSVVSVGPEMGVAELASLLLRKRISAVPVVDAEGALVGIVSEGDLIRRPELGSEPHRSWWLGLLTEPEQGALDYLKSHGRRAGEVMTRNVVTVEEDTPVGRIAELLEQRRIKRVPVLRDGRMVGIVSRADLLRGLAAHKGRLPQAASADDRAIRESLLELVRGKGWVSHGSLNVIVSDGRVELWGLVDSEEEREALVVAAETTAGVRAVECHLGLVAPYLRGT